jgi:uncharacterized protein
MKGRSPQSRDQYRILAAPIAWDYTTWLNIVFLCVAAALVWRLLKTGGPAMLRMMNAPAHQTHGRSGTQSH